MDLDFPKTREEDYIGFQRELLKIKNSRIRGEISEYESETFCKKLGEKYKGRIFEEDIIYFDNLDDLIDAFEADGVERQKAVECVNHEFRHARVALELGYNVNYSCVRSYERRGEKLFIKLFARVGVSPKLNPDDLQAILNAVDELSHLDLELAGEYSKAS